MTMLIGKLPVFLFEHLKLQAKHEVMAAALPSQWH
jgi:hypothetical protein